MISVRGGDKDNLLQKDEEKNSGVETRPPSVLYKERIGKSREASTFNPFSFKKKEKTGLREPINSQPSSSIKTKRSCTGAFCSMLSAPYRYVFKSKNKVIDHSNHDELDSHSVADLKVSQKPTHDVDEFKSSIITSKLPAKDIDMLNNCIDKKLGQEYTDFSSACNFLKNGLKLADKVMVILSLDICKDGKICLEGSFDISFVFPNAAPWNFKIQLDESYNAIINAESTNGGTVVSLEHLLSFNPLLIADYNEYLLKQAGVEIKTTSFSMKSMTLVSSSYSMVALGAITISSQIYPINIFINMQSLIIGLTIDFSDDWMNKKKIDIFGDNYISKGFIFTQVEEKFQPKTNFDIIEGRAVVDTPKADTFTAINRFKAAVKTVAFTTSNTPKTSAILSFSTSSFYVDYPLKFSNGLKNINSGITFTTGGKFNPRSENILIRWIANLKSDQYYSLIFTVSLEDISLTVTLPSHEISKTISFYGQFKAIFNLPVFQVPNFIFGVYGNLEIKDENQLVLQAACELNLIAAVVSETVFGLSMIGDWHSIILNIN